MKLSFSNLVGYLSHNKKRSLLSMLGVAVGVLSLVLMSGISGAMKENVRAEIGKMGSRLVVLAPGEFRSVGSHAMQMSTKTTLKLSDAYAVKNSIYQVEDASPLIAVAGEVHSSSATMTANVHGTWPNAQKLLDSYTKCGRFLTNQDEQEFAAVAVIGTKVAKELFGGGCPVGETILLNKSIGFRVIGVMEEKGGTGGGTDLDEMIFIPFSSAQKRLTNKDYIDAVVMLAETEDSVPVVMKDIEEMMSARHGIKDFSVMRYEELAAAGTEMLRIFSNLSRIVATIAFAVGALGIAAIMTLSVYERIVEIGIRRAFGATKRDIFLQFLAESLTLSLVGSLIGAAVSIAIVLTVQKYAGWQFYLPLQATALSIALSAAIGLLAGVYPAYRAVEFEPKSILQSE